jgi:hypothetical protein
VHGRVEVDGVAVAHGSISFLPAPGSSGPAANTVIVDGEYRFTEDSGPCCGPHRVLIDVDSQLGEGKPTGQKAAQGGKRSDIRATGKAMRAGAGRPRPSRGTVQQTAKLHWEVEHTVPDDGKCRKDFHLKG